MDWNPDLDAAESALESLPKAIDEWRAAMRKVKASGEHDKRAAAGHADDAVKAARKVGLIMEAAHDATLRVRGSLPITPPADRWATA